MMENCITSTPNNLPRLSIGGSSGRRRSLIPHNRVANIRDEQSNDDEAERSSLLASERAAATSTPNSPRRGRGDSLSSSPQKEHYQGCLKLYAENKITKDNAWNLHLIDFMTSMLRRNDARMNNFQTASTVLDATARIYSYRVDAVHYDVLKVAGGLSKAAQTKRGKKDDGNVEDEAAAPDADAAAPKKKKKKRTKAVVASNPEMLNGDFEVRDYVDPFFERLAATAGDITSSNRAFNATLPIDDNTLSLILRTDDKFLEAIDDSCPEELSLVEHITIPQKLFPPFTSEDRICEPFAGFSITNWDPETEDTERVTNWVEEHRLNLSQQALAFDVNAEVEPIPQDDNHNDLYDDEPLGGIESEEEADVAVAACVARLPAAQPVRLTDMRPSAPGHSRLEYSYNAAIVTAWAGPSHWKLKNNRASKLTERSQSTAAGRTVVEGRKAVKTKKQLDFTGAGLAFDWRTHKSPEYEPAAPAKIMISRKTLATGHTWNEANYKTPIDRGLDESHFSKLFLRRNVVMSRKRDQQPATSDAEPLTVEENKEYDYNNENDASYCLNHLSDADDWRNEDGQAAGDLHEQAKSAEPDHIGDLLEPPAKVAKIFIPYAMRAKKVDMKHLKHCTWRLLTENTPAGQKEDVTPTTFSSLYSRLPEKLSTNTRESLSVSLALLSLLHLANEKGLILEQRTDLKDEINIVGLIKR